jgi:hypothetical protein
VKRIAIVLAALLLALCAPVAAIAQLNPTNVPPALTTPDEQADPTPFDEDTGLSTRQLVLIFGGAVLVIGLIAWVIMRDARSAAPDAGRSRSHGGSVAASAPGGGSAKARSAREREREKQRKRNKAKAQRNQRKKNRPR